jgi:hypothetical protein
MYRVLNATWTDLYPPALNIHFLNQLLEIQTWKEKQRNILLIFFQMHIFTY